LILCSHFVQTQQVRQDFYRSRPAWRKGVIGGEGLARAGVGPDFRPSLRTTRLWINRGIRRQDGTVELLVRDSQPTWALVVQVGQCPLLERSSFALRP